MNLLIVESPNKVKKIKAILGNGWDVAASVGHIRDLPKEDLGIDPETYAMHYVLQGRGEEVVKQLKMRVSRADVVYLATDPDREGEAIAWHLREALKLRSYQRVTFDAITENVIRAAVRAPRQINMPLVESQQARRGADRLVGYKVSPLISRQAGISGLSAGRVQTVAVRFVVDRQAEIDAFRATKHFGAEAIFQDGKWRAQWNTAPHLAEGEKYILAAALAERAAACRSFQVEQSDSKHTTQAPPAPFTTATLLQAASVTLKMKPKQTADVAQQLFALGAITYHRTDSQNFSAEALAELRQYAASAGLPLPPKARTWKSKDNAQEAHEAIRPTHLEDKNLGETDDQKRLYRLIWNRAVASQLADAEYDVTTLRLRSLDSAEGFRFKAVGRVLTAPGWRGLTATDEAEETGQQNQEEADELPDCGAVPALAIGSQATATSSRILNKQTRPPALYTQASLIKKMEGEGIGRPSTYPAILQNITTRGYLADTDKYLRPTDLGTLLIRELKGRFAFLEYDYTRTLEQELDEIATGKATFHAVVSALDKRLDSELAALQIAPQPALGQGRSTPGSAAQTADLTSIVCPKCKQGRLRRPSPARSFYGCNGYRPDKTGCSFAVNATISGKTLTEKQIETLCDKGITPVLKGFKNKQGNAFEMAVKLSAETEWRTKFDFPKR